MIKEDFEQQIKTSNISSYIAFARAIAGCRYKREFINRYFNKMVDKAEYLQSEKGQLLDNLVKISNSEIN